MTKYISVWCGCGIITLFYVKYAKNGRRIAWRDVVDIDPDPACCGCGRDIKGAILSELNSLK
jgi:hypothetical protein